MATDAVRDQLIFISAAGADGAVAAKVRDVLVGAGYRVILQQSHFANRNFVHQMHEALASASRVVAILSPEYLASRYCAAEWQSAIAGDPLNGKGRLVLLRVADVAPPGLLSALAHWDLVLVLGDARLFSETVLGAVSSTDRVPPSGPYLRVPRAIVHPDIALKLSSFTGHERYVKTVEAELWGRGRPVVLHGLPGIGKTAVAKEYARRNLRRYSIAWLLDSSSEDGIVEGFIRLGSELLPTLPATADRRATATYVATNIVSQFREPVLLIFDGLESSELLGVWASASIVHRLATSPSARWPSGVKAIEVKPWSPRTAAAYLRRESNRPDMSVAEATEIAQHLGNVPQPVERAAVYLRSARNVSPRRYADRTALSSAPASALEISVAQAEREAPGAAAILCLASFFAAGAIPEELFHQLSSPVPPGLRPRLAGIVQTVDLRSVLADTVRLDEALAAIDRFSLMTFDAPSRSFLMSRLVQDAAQRYAGNDREEWARTAVATVGDAFPKQPDDAAPACERLWLHAQSALGLFPGEAASVAGSSLASRCGRYLMSVGRLGEAETFCRRALYMDELMYGEHHDDFVTDLNNLGEALRNQNRFDNAERCYRRALAVSETLHGPAHPKSSTVLNNLALLLNYTDRYGEAEEAFRASIAIEEKSGEAKLESIALALANLAYTLLEVDRLKEAEEAARQAVLMYESASGPDHSSATNVLTTLAQIVARSGRLVEAEEIYRRSIAITEAAYGTGHADLQRPLNGLALILSQTDRVKEAEPLFRRALALCHHFYGGYHAEAATITNNLALALKDMGRTEEAETYFRRALEIDEGTLGEKHTSVARDLTNLASLLAKSKRGAEAERFARRALQIVEEALGSMHSSVATMLNNLAEVLRAQRCFDEAEKLYERAIAIDDANGPNTIASAAVHANNLGLLYLERGRFADAEALFLRSLDCCERAYGPDHSMVALALGHVADALRALNRFDEAKALERRARSIRDGLRR